MKKSPGFDEGSLTVVGGTVTDLKSTDGVRPGPETFTPTPGYTGSASVTVNNGSYPISTATGAPATVTTPRSTPRPRAWRSTLLRPADVGETSEVTFSFSEKVTGFDEGSLTVVGGTGSPNLKSTDGGQTGPGNPSPRPRAIPAPPA
ncbi:Ig-like domain-containing protein [Aeromonas veronii]|uniref:Ig-like domain-containing protein n=1 Tax=Aeromonas veronii TaxID=654 RepID=UPI001FFFBB1F|nr:Ig-like domain-containing protein [Aeromonas veronii]UPK54812.1 Ig-like domain-containing protein [Aeromonas veronii]